MDDIEQKIIAALEALPDTPDEIAAFFANEGIGGVIQDGCNCPIAIYIQMCIDPNLGQAWRDMHISVEPVRHDRSRWNVIFDWDGESYLIELPQRVSRFADYFDWRHYPRLITADPYASLV
jgi:hypothetical protein